MKWVKERLKERSTYVGLAVALGLVGVSVPADTLQIIGSAVLAIVGAVEMARKERG